jgi:flagellar basal body-associated protein FliL
MPEKQSQNNQGGNGWWVPVLIGVLLLMVPGGVFVAPVMFLLAVIMKRKNKPRKSPETPHSPLPLINTQP